MMSDSLSFTTGELSALIGAELRGSADVRLDRLDPIDHAQTSSLTFIRSDRYARMWADSRAGAAIVTRDLAQSLIDDAPIGNSRALLLVDDADLALIRILESLHSMLPRDDMPLEGRHTSAVVDDSAEVHPSVRVAPGVVVGPRTSIGEGVALHAGVVVGSDCRIGAQTEVRANCSIMARTVIGARCLLQPGAVIGGDGFGFRPDPSGKGLVKIPHVGHVEIGDEVEIGSNSTIDRGKFGPTTIGSCTKIDNLVQIGHNCTVGRAVVICGCAGIGGSVTIGDGAMVGGGVGIRDNTTVGPGARLAAMAGVMNDIPPGTDCFGIPARPSNRAMKMLAALDRLPEMIQPLRRLIRERNETDEESVTSEGGEHRSSP